MNGVRGKGKRGFSSIVGAVFMVLIMMVLASSYFVYTLAQNTAYNAAVGQKNQLDQSVRSENLQCLNTTYTTYNDTNVNVNATILNVGSTSVQFITLWICISNDTPWAGYNFRSLINASVQPGRVYSVNLNLTVSGVVTGPNSTYNYNYGSWLVTSKGNTVALQRQIVSSSFIVSAQVAQGIGAISMNFSSFLYYNVVQSGSNYILKNYPSGGVPGYSVPASAKVAFAVNLTNFDLDSRNIQFSSASVFWVIFPVSGTQPRCAGWYIVDVYPNGTIKPAMSTITLDYGASKQVIFASKNDLMGGFTPSSAQDWWTGNQGSSAANLMLLGTIGTSPVSPFGQNVPFVSIYFT